jgi:hypothetical protein
LRTEEFDSHNSDPLACRAASTDRGEAGRLTRPEGSEHTKDSVGSTNINTSHAGRTVLADGHSVLLARRSDT